MINSIPINHTHSQNQSLGGGGSCPSESKFQEAMEVDTEHQPQSHSHTRTVQALRKYLQRKLSSEDSSSERESQSPQETDTFHQSFETPDEPKSTLTCSIVYSNPSGRGTFPLQKQRSLDDYSHPIQPLPVLFSGREVGTETPTIMDNRYLRTDLCVPVLLSRCSFCDVSFELDDQLRAHMREMHLKYFFDNYTPTPTPTPTPNAYEYQHQPRFESFPGAQEPGGALDLSMRKSTEGTGSLPNLSVISRLLGDGGGANKGPKKLVKCVTCGKFFSTKWNWKQHQKIHLRENLQA